MLIRIDWWTLFFVISKSGGKVEDMAIHARQGSLGTSMGQETELINMAMHRIRGILELEMASSGIQFLVMMSEIAKADPTQPETQIIDAGIVVRRITPLGTAALEKPFNVALVADWATRLGTVSAARKMAKKGAPQQRWFRGNCMLL